MLNKGKRQREEKRRGGRKRRGGGNDKNEEEKGLGLGLREKFRESFFVELCSTNTLKLFELCLVNMSY